MPYITGKLPVSRSIFALTSSGLPAPSNQSYTSTIPAVKISNIQYLISDIQYLISTSTIPAVKIPNIQYLISTGSVTYVKFLVIVVVVVGRRWREVVVPEPATTQSNQCCCDSSNIIYIHHIHTLHWIWSSKYLNHSTTRPSIYFVM